jgi:predicted dehydrogenase
VLKVAIVGCGKIADDHAAQIRRISGVSIVGACDRELLMAEQFADRFRIKQVFADFEELIRICQPDAVHITTPPQSHYALARKCLENGISAYVEKPFTVTGDEAASLVAIATEYGTKVTVGHDLQFSHVARRLRAVVREGYLGGNPVHLESYYCYDLGDMKYARTLLGDKEHWIRKLPGGLLHNVISHGIARLSEYLTSDAPNIFARGFASPLLRDLGEETIIDELRVIVQESGGLTGYFTFSSQMRPLLNQFRIYGPANGLLLDEDEQSLIKLRGSRFKSYAEKFLPPILLSGQQLSNLWYNMREFLAADFHMKSGLKFLIESFYRSVIDGAPVPIPYREIVLTSRIMDEIFSQLIPLQRISSVERAESEFACSK